MPASRPSPPPSTAPVPAPGRGAFRCFGVLLDRKILRTFIFGEKNGDVFRPEACSLKGVNCSVNL